MPEGIERSTVRKFVPETDPVYLAERQRWQNVSRETIQGENALWLYERALEDEGRIAASDLKQNEYLSTIDPTGQDAENARNAMRSRREMMANLKERNTARLRDNFARLLQEAGTLLDASGFKDRKTYVVGEVKDMLAGEDLQAELKRIFGDDFSTFTDKELLEKVRGGEVSTDFIYRAQKNHVEKIERQAAQFETFVEKTRSEFGAAVRAAVAEGFLPATAESALHRIGSSKVVLVDRLLDMFSDVLGQHGNAGIISVLNDRFTAESLPAVRKTLFHEFFHEISGKSITVETTVDESVGEHHRAYDKKSGVSISGPYRTVQPNRWLNEGITEWLAIRLSGHTDTGKYAYGGSSSYTNERRELDRLFSVGLDTRVVTNAYFENFTTNESGERGKHFAELVKTIGRLEGDGGFNRLENIQIAHEIYRELYAAPAFAIESLPDDLIEASSARIILEVGTTEATRARREFRCIPLPGQDPVKKSADILSSEKERYKKISYSIEEIKKAA